MIHYAIAWQKQSENLGDVLHALAREQLRTARKECGFEYIRFHGLLAEDMFVCHRVNGSIQYNWYYIDALYDFLLETGVRPIVEFGFMPPGAGQRGADPVLAAGQCDAARKL